MMSRMTWLSLLCVAVLVFLEGCQAHNPRDNPEYYVFRGDSRPPKDIRAAGGFLPDPNTSYRDSRTFSLDNHVHGRSGSSAYVATSGNFGQAARNFAGVGNYVYRVHVTPNMINVNEALLNHQYTRQEEASALGGIPWRAVEGWYLLQDDPEFQSSEEILDDDAAARLTARYEMEFADRFVANRQYDDGGLGGPTTLTRADPDVDSLASQPPKETEMQNTAIAFMNRYGLTIGWTVNQNFPYTPPPPPPRDEPMDWEDVDLSDISDVEMENLTERRYETVNCQHVAVVLGLGLLQNKGPRLKRSGPYAACVALTPRDNKKEAECERIRDVLRRLRPKKKQKLCRKINSLEFEMVLSNDYWSGTYDKVAGTLEGPAGKAKFVFEEAPSRGTQKTISVDIKKSFGSDEIDLNGITKITLTAKGDFWKLSNNKNDQFQVQDIRMRAKCSEPSFSAQHDKFVGINAWYGHPGGWLLEPFEEKTVATFQVAPGDWSFTPPCGVIKDLRYDFKVADTSGGGTYDKLYLTLGQSKRIILGDSVSAGYAKAETVNLKDTFGNTTVDLPTLNRVALWDELGSSVLSGDTWTFQGITLSAMCASVPKTIQVNKFESVHQDVKHVEDAPAWVGHISSQDWLEVV